MTAIQRLPLREQIHDVLLQEIYAGILPEEKRIRDRDVAERLGVSRTPVREALLRLEREGLVEADAGRGFTVAPLLLSDVTEAYPIAGTLECLALEQCGTLDATRLADLVRMNDLIATSAHEPEKLLELDSHWHKTLLADCQNNLLMTIVASIRQRLARYEYAYMRGAGHVAVSADHHARIIRALRSGDMAEAKRWLLENWVYTMRELTHWLKGREESRAKPSTRRARASQTSA